MTDNISAFLTAAKRYERHGLRTICLFETVDLYDARNMPSVIYCLHVFSHVLARLGMSSSLRHIRGMQFEEADLVATQNAIAASGAQMPNFGDLAKEYGHEPEPEPEPEETEDERASADRCRCS